MTILTAFPFPYHCPVPFQIGLTRPPANPGVPPNMSIASETRTSSVLHTVGAGAERTYLDIQKQSPRSPHPPRPVPGSIADLDIIMDNCDFSTGKVRVFCCMYQSRN